MRHTEMLHYLISWKIFSSSRIYQTLLVYTKQVVMPNYFISASVIWAYQNLCAHNTHAEHWFSEVFSQCHTDSRLSHCNGASYAWHCKSTFGCPWSFTFSRTEFGSHIWNETNNHPESKIRGGALSVSPAPQLNVITLRFSRQP